MSINVLKKTKERCTRGSLTVFMALCCGIIAALLLSAEEACRTQGARLYLTMLSNSAIDSLFSQYHRSLWKDYRLLGLEHYSDEQLREEFKGFAKPYLEADNYYPLEFRGVEVEDKKLMTEEEGELFEQSVLSYMQYGAVESLWSSGFVEGLLGDIKDGISLSGFQQSYGDHTKAAMRLEESLEALQDCIERQEEHEQAAVRAAEDCNSYRFRSELSGLDRELSSLEGLVEDYQKKADDLKKALSETKQEYQEKRSSGELSEQSAKALFSEIEKYDTYVEEDGVRRQQVSALPAQAKDNIRYIEDMVSMSEDIDEEIASYIPEEGDEGIDIEALWAPLRVRINAYEGLSLDVRRGVEDKESERKLESIMELLDMELLDLVIPKGMEPSREELRLEDAPSETDFSGNDGSRLGIMDKILLTEYMGISMNYFGRERDEGEKKGSGACELEYILYGEKSDRENLEAAVKELMLMRSGLNLMHILSDAKKRSEAQQLALMISGALGFTPIVGIMAFFIMSVWAVAQAFCDLKALMEGKKVRFMHTEDSFSFSLDSLLDFDTGKAETKEDEGGLYYKEYLKLLMIMRQGSELDYRCMDMIQMSIARGQQDFRLSNCAVALDLRINAASRHVFSETGMVKAIKGADMETEHIISLDTAFCY